jgi:hypothetical protein
VNWAVAPYDHDGIRMYYGVMARTVYHATVYYEINVIGACHQSATTHDLKIQYYPMVSALSIQ